LTAYAFTVQPTYSTITASCHLPTRAAKANKRAAITPAAKAAKKIIAAAKLARGVPLDVPLDAGERKAARRARRARAGLQKRAPDLATITKTELDPLLFVTSISTAYAPTQTTTTTVVMTAMSTTTPGPATVYSGVYSTAVIITAPKPTVTKTRIILATFVIKWATVTAQ